MERKNEIPRSRTSDTRGTPPRSVINITDLVKKINRDRLSPCRDTISEKHEVGLAMFDDPVRAALHRSIHRSLDPLPMDFKKRFWVKVSRLQVQGVEGLRAMCSVFAEMEGGVTC